MPNHLQSRTDDMHKGKARRTFGISTMAIIGALTAVIALILFLT